MNIRVRAAIEVASFVVGIIVVSALVSVGLDVVLAKFGVNAIVGALAVAAATYFVYMAYQVRVSQLEFDKNTKLD